MAEIKGNVITANVSSIEVPGRLNEDGRVGFRARCTSKDLIVYMSPEDARELAEGLLQAADDAGKVE